MNGHGLIGRFSTLVAAATLLVGAAKCQAAGGHATTETRASQRVQVAGHGVDLLSTAIVHSKETTATGYIQKGTESVDLEGDLRGRVLYHVTSEVDEVHGTLVNTGEEVFSGTVVGSAPVLIHDDQFRFEVNLVTGEEHGQVYLVNPLAGPKVRCTLDVVGTGLNGDGNPTFDYTGECVFRGR